MVLIGGTKHPALTEEIAGVLGVTLADTKISRFSDGECAIRVIQEVRGRCVYIVQPCGEDTSDSIMELLLTISTVKRAGCKNVTAVIPYFPFKHYRRGMPKSKKLHSKFLVSGPTDFGKMLEAMDVDRVISVGLQRPGQGQEACFFDNSIPLEDVTTTHITTEYFKNNVKLEGPIVLMSPNDECLKKAVKFEKDFRVIYPKSKFSIVASVHRGASVYKDNSGDFEILGKFEVMWCS
jgi:ribose-phosphate pyrophosphokinase